ncbi:malonyl-ACP O-methyltransferase BioC [Marininema halotolerans]|uniref:Malonyl-[acyl-carrier protein] O-methyltransferase n=1 Tax=Marininema halotolerans TaxID=1155944 RepID=A0A1I6NSI1_9BACL|nr:malonyl-ACP O-methyltransferase BioC [Marininema halotolerans]SFS30907.1 malonyl-CoA O-methyltransferase [Marininema halotolerans]
MEKEKELIARQFNRYADEYDQVAVVQQRMAHRILETLDEQGAEPERILEIGCGTGYLTQLLGERFPNAKYTVIDIAENMIKLARKRVNEGLTIQFVVGDVEDQTWEAESFDLIVSNATVHWLTRPECTLINLSKALKPGGLFVASTFGPDTLGELDQIYQNLSLNESYPEQRRYRFQSPEEWVRMMDEADIEGDYAVCWHRIHYPETVSLLGAIQRMGADYIHTEEEQLHGQNDTVRVVVEDHYDRIYRTREGGVYATYQLVQIYGQKRLPS